MGDARLVVEASADDRSKRAGGLRDLRTFFQVDGVAFADVAGRLAVTTVSRGLREHPAKTVTKFRQVDAVLRTAWTRDGGLHAGKIQVEVHAVVDLPALGHPKHPLRAEVALEGGALLVGSAGGAQVGGTLGIDGEKTHRRAVFRRHVGDGGAVGQGQARGALAVKFDELAHHLAGAQHLGGVQRQVRRGDAFAQRAAQVDAHHFRRQKVHRLSEHPGLGFNAADSPANDAEAVDHGRVRIRADEGIRIVKGAPSGRALLSTPFAKYSRLT